LNQLKQRTRNSIKSNETHFYKKSIDKTFCIIKKQIAEGVLHKYLYDNDILHKLDRHKSLSNVESLNKQLAILIMRYLNTIKMKTKIVSKNWLPIIPIFRDELNKLKCKKLL